MSEERSDELIHGDAIRSHMLRGPPTREYSVEAWRAMAKVAEVALRAKEPRKNNLSNYLRGRMA
jgi:hypothetical protein